MPKHANVPSAVNHLFRHASGRLVAALTRVLGAQNIGLVEDVVQETLLTALDRWKYQGIPEKPEAWLFIVAKNKALNLLKKQRHQIRFGNDVDQQLLQSGYTLESTFEQLTDEELIRDDQLRMMFACCNPGISEENQVTLILKTLCGFSTAEIAKAFLTQESAISKRLYRSKEFFRQHPTPLVIPDATELPLRTRAVLQTIYLLFNEGYHSSKTAQPLRHDLMEEALLLCKLITENVLTQMPEAFALLALMCFHAARSNSRIDSDGKLVLLPDQDRSRWNTALIEEGMSYFETAMRGHELTTYHLEAAIAFEHCIAKNFESTNWARILAHYDLLCRISPSVVAELNKTIALLYAKGTDAASEYLENLSQNQPIQEHYLYYHLKGELLARAGAPDQARWYFETAMQHTELETERTLLMYKIGAL
ncbi:MAG: sigma-70 family RNA polymerase sigma factor [Bacteroidota bacterium]